MKAVVIHGTNARVERDRPLPKLRDDYVLVKTVAVALNPTDWKHIAGGMAADGGISGCDFSGVVEEVGSAVRKPWEKGDRICGVTHGGNLYQVEDGAFAEYIVAKGDIQIKIPDDMTFTQAATIGLGATTVGQGLYQKALELSLPGESHSKGEKGNLFIYGGSTATGSLAIQYANLSGYTVFTTCSPKNFEYVKSIGATEAFDYNDHTSIDKLRTCTNSTRLKLAWDTIGTKETAQFCADALSNEPGCKYGCISFPPVQLQREDVSSIGVLMYSVFGEAFEKRGHKFPASSQDYEFAKKFMNITEKLLASGQLRPHAELVGQRGLEGVLEGLEKLKTGQVSGSKLVYVVGDTP